ncbi:MAG: GNAT family N-acetyltransferase [Oscillospiraceae bacterium]|nr:GNAT family N-acetyltransferase [Oscillospiraceae bacterium]
MYRVDWKNGNKDIGDSYLIRRQVFLIERGFPMGDESDERDINAEHITVYFDDKAIGTARVFIEINKEESSYIIGRVAVLDRYRKKGIGKFIISEILTYLEDKKDKKDIKKVKLHAVCDVKDFYKKHGFKSIGEKYIDDGLDHIVMEKNI